MELGFATFDGWHYVTINGKPDRFGFSSLPAVGRRYIAILNGWL